MPARAELQAIAALRSRLLAGLAAPRPRRPPAAVRPAGVGHRHAVALGADGRHRGGPAGPPARGAAGRARRAGRAGRGQGPRSTWSPTSCGCSSCGAERDLPTMETSHHLVFTGNPGTGKTTVARLLAQIYRTLGVVRPGPPGRDRPLRPGGGLRRPDRPHGHRGLRRADEGMLFIDEAYTLARGGENDFGREAIDQIVKLMEDRRDRVVLVVAGYPDEMDGVPRRQPRPAVALPHRHRLPRLHHRRAGRASSTASGPSSATSSTPDGGGQAPRRARRRCPAPRASATPGRPATCSRPPSTATPAGS